MGEKDLCDTLNRIGTRRDYGRYCGTGACGLIAHHSFTSKKWGYITYSRAGLEGGIFHDGYSAIIR